jgi:hypothetical protein
MSVVTGIQGPDLIVNIDTGSARFIIRSNAIEFFN